MIRKIVQWYRLIRLSRALGKASRELGRLIDMLEIESERHRLG